MLCVGPFFVGLSMVRMNGFAIGWWLVLLFGGLRLASDLVNGAYAVELKGMQRLYVRHRRVI